MPFVSSQAEMSTITVSKLKRAILLIVPLLYGLRGTFPARFCTTINLIPGFRISAPSHMKVLHIPLLDDESTDLTPYFTTVFKVGTLCSSLSEIAAIIAIIITSGGLNPREPVAGEVKDAQRSMYWQRGSFDYDDTIKQGICNISDARISLVLPK